MRSTTYKLSLTVAALLLAHCASPSEDTDESSAAVGDDTSFDSRGGLREVHVTKSAPRSRASDPGADAIAYLENAATAAGAKSPEFKVLGISTGEDGLTHVRVQQIHDGRPVWGADSVVHLSSGAIVGAAGSIATKVDVTESRSGGMTGKAALAKAKADRFGSRPVTTERETAERLVHVDEGGVSHNAIHTAFFNEQQGELEPAFWHHIYDADSGKLLARWNGLHTIEQASGPGGNPKWVHAWSSELDVEAKAGGFALTTAALKTLDLKQGQSGGSEVVGSLETIGDAPINDAHGFAEITLNVLKGYGYNSIDERGFQILSRVHYGRNYENAFWDGKQMTYGDGANTFYPLSGGLDVVAHEIHHGFTSFHSNLAYRGEPGGLNEGFSDIAGKVAEFIYKPEANFDLGGDVFKKPNAALRYMCDPKKDGRSIDHASKMTPSLDPHYSSGVPNKVFCRSSKRFSAAGDAEGTATRDGVKRAAQAFYLANGKYWTSSTTFIAACKGTLDAARALNFSAEELGYLQSSWADVGVTCQ